jgi:ferritin
MTWSKDLEGAFNDQIAREFSSAYGYLAKAAYFEEANLPGFANWMHVQWQEEISHAMRFYRFMLDRGAHVHLQEIPEPRCEYGSASVAFEDALAGEVALTANIRDLYEQATAEKDYASFPLLQWFIEEQVEEENLVSAALERLRMAGDNPSALLLLDSEFGGRSREESG